MKQVTLTFTEQEFHELARQLYLAGFFVNDQNFPDKAIAKAVEQKVCTAGFNQLNEQAYYEPGMYNEGAYRISLQQSDMLQPFVDSYQKFVIANYISEQLAERDFEEKHGPIKNIDFDEHPQLVIQRRDMLFEYALELKANGLRNLRLIRIDKN